MKLIRKYQYAGVLPSDNTRVKVNYVPEVPKERYTPKINIISELRRRHGEKQTLFKSDTRTKEAKAVDNAKVHDLLMQLQKSENNRMIGTIAYPVGIGVAQFIPGLNILTNLGLAGMSAYNLTSDNGVKKTWNAFNESRYGDATKSAVGDILDASMIIGGPIAAYKSTVSSPLWRTAMYNNISPASYSNTMSWHPKGKIGEFFSGIKDYFTGNTKMLEHPKWENSLAEWFNDDAILKRPWAAGIDHVASRKEAFQIYQGIPRKTLYILNTGKVDAQGNTIYTLNKELVPESTQQLYFENAGSTTKGHFGDIANYGGNVGVKKETLSPLTGRLTIDDVFDVLPLLDPGRIAESLPKVIRPILFKRYPGTEYTYSYKHQPWVPKWLRELEFGKITGGKPFRSTTSWIGEIKDRYPIKPLTFDDVKRYRLDLMEQAISSEEAYLPYEQMSESEIQLAKNKIYKKASDYVGKMTDGEIASKFRRHLNPTEYWQEQNVYNIPRSWWSREF